MYSLGLLNIWIRAAGTMFLKMSKQVHDNIVKSVAFVKDS